LSNSLYTPQICFNFRLGAEDV